ncbi:MAG TPA: RNA 2',3'-cyclic phosphodiesterase [Gammaproteobacteria bacterium]|nr:RNA 2',3'-cyclic phosphodiesterase [Gammaproteobacteria bacterium]
MAPAETRRLFFALRPSAALQDELVRRTRKLVRGGGGRPVGPEKLHLTLAFLGSLDEAAQACVEAAADGMHGEPFRLVFDTLGHFPRPRVIWAGASVIPPALSALVQELTRALLPCGYRPESRPFKAHVTLMRKVGHGPQATALDPLVWDVRDFALVESVTLPEGAQYRVLRRWPLHGAGEDEPRTE